jgi:hypothetical protein
VLRHICGQGGVDLTQLRRRVVDELDAAAVAVATSLDRGHATPRPAPRGFDLHPRRRLVIDKNGVRITPSGNSTQTPNH